MSFIDHVCDKVQETANEHEVTLVRVGRSLYAWISGVAQSQTPTIHGIPVELDLSLRDYAFFMDHEPVFEEKSG